MKNKTIAVNNGRIFFRLNDGPVFELKSNGRTIDLTVAYKLKNQLGGLGLEMTIENIDENIITICELMREVNVPENIKTILKNRINTALPGKGPITDDTPASFVFNNLSVDYLSKIRGVGKTTSEYYKLMEKKFNDGKTN